MGLLFMVSLPSEHSRRFFPELRYTFSNVILMFLFWSMNKKRGMNANILNIDP